MFHSVIIPHRGRARFLNQCVRRLCHVAGGTHDLEIVVSNEDADDWEASYRAEGVSVRVIHTPRRGKLFNKCVLLNAGIEAAGGEVLTFLDADALVGIDFFEAASLACSPRLTKVCYRVRVLPSSALALLEAGERNANQTIEGWFDNWESYTVGPEAYGTPSCFNGKEGGDPVYGNSQFSIARSALGSLRFDERYEGAGFEDIAFNRDIAFEYGERYIAAIMTDPDHAMFHIRNERESDWFTPESNLHNTVRYERERERKAG